MGLRDFKVLRMTAIRDLPMVSAGGTPGMPMRDQGALRDFDAPSGMGEAQPFQLFRVRLHTLKSDMAAQPD
jgi:hypothetical protein